MTGHRCGPGFPRGTAFWAVAVVAGFTVCIEVQVGGARATDVIDDIGTASAAAAATLACIAAARGADRRYRRFWTLLATAVAAWTFGEGAWAVYDLALEPPVPVPSIADIGYLGAVPLAAAALLSHPSYRASRRNSVRRPLDATIVATGVLFLGWTFVLAPVWRSSDLSAAAGVVAVAYPFGDVVLICLLVGVVGNLDGRMPRALWPVLLGLLAMALSDSAYTYLTVTRGYETGDLIDIGWFAAYLAIAVGASWHTADHADSQPLRTTSETAAGLVTAVLPTLVALAVIALRTEMGYPTDTTALLLAFALSGLVVIRQAIEPLPHHLTPDAAAGKADTS